MHESLCLLTTMQAAGVYKEKRAASIHTSEEQPGCFLQGCVCVCVCVSPCSKAQPQIHA